MTDDIDFWTRAERSRRVFLRPRTSQLIQCALYTWTNPCSLKVIFHRNSTERIENIYIRNKHRSFAQWSSDEQSLFWSIYRIIGRSLWSIRQRKTQFHLRAVSEKMRILTVNDIVGKFSWGGGNPSTPPQDAFIRELKTIKGLLEPVS